MRNHNNQSLQSSNWFYLVFYSAVLFQIKSLIWPVKHRCLHELRGRISLSLSLSSLYYPHHYFFSLGPALLLCHLYIIHSSVPFPSDLLYLTAVSFICALLIKFLSIQMAAFSFEHYPCPFDSDFLLDTNPKMPSFQEQGVMNASIFNYYPPCYLPNTAISAATHESSSLVPGTDPLFAENHVDCSNEASVTHKHQADSISSPLAAKVPQQNSPMNRKRKNRDGSCLDSAESKVGHLNLFI